MRELPVVARRTMLVHDDNSIVNDMIELIFEDEYRIMKSTDIDVTLSCLKENRIDCFISEFDITGACTGPELVKKARDANPMIKPFLTAYMSTPEKEDVSRASGALALFPKPFDMKQFRQTVQEALV